MNSEQMGHKHNPSITHVYCLSSDCTFPKTILGFSIRISGILHLNGLAVKIPLPPTFFFFFFFDHNTCHNIKQPETSHQIWNPNQDVNRLFQWPDMEACLAWSNTNPPTHIFPPQDGIPEAGGFCGLIFFFFPSFFSWHLGWFKLLPALPA